MKCPCLFAMGAMGALAVACSTGSGGPEDAAPPPMEATPCAAGVLGDTTKPVEMSLTVLQPDGHDTPIKDGDDVPLVFPPQGGRVVFVGVRATNLDACGLVLSGALRDEATNKVTFEERTINLNATGDGWGTSGSSSGDMMAVIANYSNVPACPNEWASTDIYGHSFGLEVKVKDREGRMAMQAIKVTPRCAEPDKLAECLCKCKAGYMLGEPCNDGGASDASDAGDAE